MENNAHSLKRTARIAGLLFLIWILTGAYSMSFIPSRIDLKGDTATAAQNILTHEFLFRSGILTDLIGITVWVILVLVFYQLFRQVHDHYAKLLVALVIVQIPVVFIMEAFQLASLMILKGEVMTTFDLNQRQDMAMFFLSINEYGTLALLLFWGLWLFPLAFLVYRSRFLPRFLGVWLIINGIAYVIMSVTDLLFPPYRDLVFKFSFPAMLGEVALMLWLLIAGARNLSPAAESSPR